MRISILGSVALPVPPPAQGGTEWIAYHQAKGLASLGHKVILFAARGSLKEENYELVEVGGGDTVVGSTCGQATDIESSRALRKENVYLAEVIDELIKRRDDYDIILNNMRGEAVFIPLVKMLNKPLINVTHLPLFAELADLFRRYKTQIITVSNAQRKAFPDLNYLATVYNCVDTERFLFNESPRPPNGDYLLMMGTIGRHKNQGAAIRVAKKLGMKLILAGKIRDALYYKELEKDIDGENIKWVGEIGFPEKLSLYQNAKAFLFPILWEEPFGLVMIESMACGTPVVAYGNGAIPEVLVDGKTGFVIKDNSQQITVDKKQKGEEGLVEAVETIRSLPPDKYKKMREDCRAHVLENFTVKKMVGDYEKALLSL